MSIETLNLLSDSTFGDKLDEQNAILEDIRDNISGGSVPDATTSTKGVVTLANSVTSGDTTHVPTANAVYNAIQSAGGINRIAPKPYSEASINDDMFITAHTPDISEATIYKNYSVKGYTQIYNMTARVFVRLKASTYGLTNLTDLFNHILFITMYEGSSSIHFDFNNITLMDNGYFSIPTYYLSGTKDITFYLLYI